MSAWARAALAIVALAGCARPAPSPTTSPSSSPVPDGALSAPVFVVRHAEKAAVPGDDPPLSTAGVERAAALRLRLTDVALGGIVVTNRLRTRQTAEPTILAQRIDTMPGAGRVVRVPLGADGVAAHAGRVADSARALARRTRGPVLVVGHSNTVGPIVQALGGPDYGDLCDTEYAWLFVVTPKTDTGVELTRLTYGAPNAPDAACDRRMRP